jgi:hypothetical protein
VKLKPVWFALAIVVLATSAPHKLEAVTPVNCPARVQTAELEPLDRGPLTLAAVYCKPVPITSLPESKPLISPDGGAIAYYEYKSKLRIGRLDSGPDWIDHPIKPGVIPRFGSNIRTGPAFAWHSDSRAIWASRQETISPSGFATGPLQPVILENGAIRTLPQPLHGSGPLDALLWAGGDGLAVAQFGTRGGYYRPEHPDAAPTFAIIDATRGAVLDTLPFAALPSGNLRSDSPSIRVKDAAATILPDGRVSVFLSMGDWIFWTQGETPVIVPNPYPYPHDLNNQMAITPDGSRLLVSRMLRTGGYCIRNGGCKPGTPVEGVLAALHDLTTGRELWALRARVTHDHVFPSPAISPDGRHALIGLVENDTLSIALVSLADGSIVQRLPGAGKSMGFTREGRMIWTHAHGTTALYDFAASPR